MKPRKASTIGNMFLGFGLLGVFGFAIYWIVTSIWGELISIDRQLAVAIVGAFTTVVAATITVTYGKYIERKREIESHFREKKTKIYDDVLKEIFTIFHGADKARTDDHLVDFLREWQRRMLLWGGADAFKKFLEWKAHLSTGEPDAEAIFKMGDFCLALRKDLGLSNSGLGRETMARIILKHPELFLSMAKENRAVKLSELAEAETRMGLNDS